jgi:GNAT superfamily N-acetyltransferase
METPVEKVHLDEVEKRLLDTFDDGPRSRSHTKEIAERAGVTRHTAAKYLSVLEARGLIGHEQVGNAKVWYPIGDEVGVRSLSIDDFEELVALAERLPAIGDADDDLANFRRELRAHLEDQSDFCVGAEADGTLVGFVIADRSSWEFGSSADVGWVRILGVRPDYQGKGIGRRLFDEAFARFRDVGIERVRTIIGWERSDVLPFFHELGFDMKESTVLERTINTDTSP